MTDVIETKQGFLILQVLEHYEEGEQPFDKVENEIRTIFTTTKWSLLSANTSRPFASRAMSSSSPVIQEMAGGGNSEIEEVSATPEATKEKKGHKKYLLFGKTTEPKS